MNKPASPRDCRILIVDNDPIDRLLSETTLVRLGLAVHSAADSAEAFDVLGRESFDLILMACPSSCDGNPASPPPIRGLADLRQIPVIALLGGSSARQIGLGTWGAFDDTIEKPIAEPELGRMFRRWIPDDLHSGMTESGAVRHAPAVERATLDTLAEAFTDTPGGLAGVVAIFSDTIAAERVRLRESVVANDSDAIARSAHRMAGASLQIGARLLGTSCTRIESAARAGTIGGADLDLRAIDSLFASVREELAAYLERQPREAPI